jgi:class 3 adenylate cyclase
VQLAAPSEVLASSTVASELTGSPTYSFVSRGVQTLRGIREPVELFTLERAGTVSRGAS